MIVERYDRPLRTLVSTVVARAALVALQSLQTDLLQTSNVNKLAGLRHALCINSEALYD